MITSLQIGPNGRLGNQMFQYAAMVGLSKVKNFDWKLHDHDEMLLWDAFKLPGTSKILDEDLKIIKYRYKESSFYFDTSIFMQKDDTDIYGYFQSPLYFMHCYDEIKSQLDFKDSIKKEALKLNK